LLNPADLLPVIPVIDLMGGVVVRAVGGDRRRYTPIESPLAAADRPLEMARALVQRTGGQQLYVADLDAIGGAVPAWQLYCELLAAQVELWLDIGLTNAVQADELGRFQEGGQSIHRVVAALETLPDFRTLGDMVSVLGAERLVFSLDLRHGRSMACAAALRKLPPMALVEAAVAHGVKQLIVIDVVAVGTRKGLAVLDLCRQIRRGHPEIKLAAGGGVRGTGDLAQLHDAGADIALASTWLHEDGPQMTQIRADGRAVQ
jgi:phosphoribosylformimino-5-aminoimidazole carboxamide ribotide isomerase